jgi:TPR repeat protein
MKLNRLVCGFLFLLLILTQQGSGHANDATAAEKTASVAITNNSTDSGNDSTRTFNETKVRAERGDANAQYNLGVCYAQGDGVAKDEAEAVKWWRKAAEHNDAEAQYYLGICYVHGNGVAKDEAEAVKWYRKAADQNNAEAQHDLGLCYAHGIGVEKDEVEAVKWYRKAAGQGNPDAQFAVGFFY